MARFDRRGDHGGPRAARRKHRRDARACRSAINAAAADHRCRARRPRTGAASPRCKCFQSPNGKVAPMNPPMIYGSRFYAVVVTAFVFCPMAQLRAEEKEPFAVIELGAATERSFQDGTYSVGPSASVEFPVIKDWLEIETGNSPLFRPGQTEWQADLLFKRPCWAIFRPNRDHGPTSSPRRGCAFLNPDRYQEQSARRPRDPRAVLTLATSYVLSRKDFSKFSAALPAAICGACTSLFARRRNMAQIFYHCSNTEGVLVDRCGTAADDLVEACEHAAAIVG